VLGQVTEADLPLPLTEVEPAALRGVREAAYEVGAQLAHWVGAR
jgi:hypothetical protein